MVNDPAGRSVKLIQDFISTSTDENLTKKETKNLKFNKFSFLWKYCGIYINSNHITCKFIVQIF